MNRNTNQSNFDQTFSPHPILFKKSEIPMVSKIGSGSISPTKSDSIKKDAVHDQSYQSSQGHLAYTGKHVYQPTDYLSQEHKIFSIDLPIDLPVAQFNDNDVIDRPVSDVELTQLLNRLKTSLRERGSSTLHGMGHVFKEIGHRHSGSRVDKLDFYEGSHLFGFNMTKDELDIIWGHLDKQRKGSITFEDFLLGLRSVNNKRKMIIDNVFNQFDHDQDGLITISELTGKDEEFKTFFAKNIARDNKGVVTRDDFEEFYAKLSASCDNDEEFELILRRAWKLE